MAEADEVSNVEEIEDAASNTETENTETEESGEEAGDTETEESAGDVEKESDSLATKTISRPEQRIRALVEERNREKEARIRAETLASERERSATITRSQNPDEARRVREERLSLMDPSERREFESNERIQRMESEVMRTRVETQDLLDKNGFKAEAKNNPIYAKHQDEVERRYMEGCRKGVWYPRETYLAVVIGEAALKAKPDVKRKEEAKQRVDSSKGTSVSGRSNVSTARSNRGEKTFEELERSLENIII